MPWPVRFRPRFGTVRCAHDGLGCCKGLRQKEPIIATAITPESWAYADEFIAEDEPLASARARAEEVGITPIGSGGGAALRLLASLTQASSVVEIGTGTGVSGLWLLRGMAEGGVLTSVDREAEHQRLARETFVEAAVPSNRFRLIAGSALDVLPRLTDGHYDLIYVDADKREYAEYVEEAIRLLRPGGVLAIDNALWHGRVADPAQRDAETVAVRDLGTTIRQDERLLSVLLPVGDGLIVAQRLT